MSFGQKIKYMLGAAMLAGTAMLSMPSPAMASVQCPEGSLRETADRVSECNVEEVSEGKQLPKVAITLIDVILGALGIVAVVVVILGGIQFVTSTGDPAKTKKAKDTILYGIIGLVVALLAFAIVNFVLGAL